MTDEKNYPLVTNARFVDAFGLARSMFVSHALSLMDAKSELSREDLRVLCLRWTSEDKFERMMEVTTQEGIFQCRVGTDDIVIRLRESELAKRLENPSPHARTYAGAPAGARTRAELVHLRLNDTYSREREREYIYNSLSLSTTYELVESSRSGTTARTGARADAGTDAPAASIFAPLSPEEVESLSSRYGVNEVESACLKARSNPKLDKSESIYPRRFYGYVDTCLRNAWPKGNPDAPAQNSARARASAKPAQPKASGPLRPALPPPDAEAQLEAIKAIRQKTKLDTVNKPMDAYTPDAHTSVPNKVPSGMTRASRERMEAELRMQREGKQMVEGFMDAPDLRQEQRV